jgi:hypothetical protein
MAFQALSKLLAASLLAGMLPASAAWAQGQQPGRVRATIETVDGDMMSIKTRKGETLKMKLADNARISALVKASLDDIKHDSFIGIAGLPQPDGAIKAFSIHMFLPAQRGVVPDRHGPWDARPGSTMTNAYVESKVRGKDGEVLKVKYKEGEKDVIVTPETVIAAVAPADRSELKPGAHIVIFAATKQPDGSLVASSLYVGRGVTPAM